MKEKIHYSDQEKEKYLFNNTALHIDDIRKIVKLLCTLPFKELKDLGKAITLFSKGVK